MAFRLAEMPLSSPRGAKYYIFGAKKNSIQRGKMKPHLKFRCEAIFSDHRSGLANVAFSKYTQYFNLKNCELARYL